VLRLLLFRCFLLGLTFESLEELGVRQSRSDGRAITFVTQRIVLSETPDEVSTQANKLSKALLDRNRLAREEQTKSGQLSTESKKSGEAWILPTRSVGRKVESKAENPTMSEDPDVDMEQTDTWKFQNKSDGRSHAPSTELPA
jgi:hypothetical protein